MWLLKAIGTVFALLFGLIDLIITAAFVIVGLVVGGIIFILTGGWR